MHPAQQAQTCHAEQPRAVVEAGGQTTVATLHRLQGDSSEADQIGPYNANDGCRDPVSGVESRHLLLQPADGQQQPDDDHRTGHRIAQAGELHCRAGGESRLPTHRERQPHCKCRSQQ